MREKKVIFSLTALIILLTCSLGYVLAQTPTSSLYITPGIYPTEISYTIWREGVTPNIYYFAKDANGQIDYSSNNGSYVIQQAVTATTYGIIYIKAGLYDLDHAIDLTGKRGITLRGDYKGRYEDNATGTILRLYPTGNPDHVIKKLETTPAKIYPITIENLHIVGSGNTSYDGIHIEYTKRFIIRDCLVNWAGRRCISITHSCEIFWVQRNELIGGAAGVYIATSLEGIITDNAIGTNTRGIHLYNYAYGHHIRGNSIWEQTAEQIKVEGTSYENRIIGNDLYAGYNHGISLTQNASWNILVANHIKGPTLAGIFITDYGIASTYNIIDACIVLNPGTWGLQEINQGNFTTVTDSNFLNPGTGGILFNGSQSHASDCWNGSTWIS